MLSPPIFAAWFYLRRLIWRVMGYKLQRLDPPSGISNFVENEVMSHNLGNLWIINRGRTERLISILRSIQSVDLACARMLVVGPRNEAELLLLRAYGLVARNISAIDLFTYAPTIHLMDMHALAYPDDQFDCVYSSFVITYSDDIPRAIRETIRVGREDALIIFAFQHMSEGDVNKFGLNRLSGGTRELLNQFGPHVRSVLWAEDHEQEDGSTICSVIFRQKKNLNKVN